MSKTSQKNLRFDGETQALLDELCKATGRSPSEVTTEALHMCGPVLGFCHQQADEFFYNLVMAHINAHRLHAPRAIESRKGHHKAKR